MSSEKCGEHHARSDVRGESYEGELNEKEGTNKFKPRPVRPAYNVSRVHVGEPKQHTPTPHSNSRRSETRRDLVRCSRETPYEPNHQDRTSPHRAELCEPLVFLVSGHFWRQRRNSSTDAPFGPSSQRSFHFPFYRSREEVARNAAEKGANRRDEQDYHAG